MTKKRFIKILPWLLAVGLLIWVLRAIPLADTWTALQQLRWGQILLLIALNGLILVLLNGRWWIILRGHGQRIPFHSLFGYRLATFGVSYFTPGPHFGGEPLQVYLVEKEQRTPRATAIAAMSLDKSLELLANFTFLLAGITIIVQQRTLHESLGFELILFAGLLLLIPAGYLLAIWTGHAPISWLVLQVSRLPFWRYKGDGQRRIKRGQLAVYGSEQEAAAFCRRAPWSVILALLISLATWVLMLTEFWLMVSFLGLSLSLLQLVTALTAARIAILLLLPGGIGALEASQAFAFGAMGLNPAIGISASLLIRGRDIILGTIGLWWGSKKVAVARRFQPLEKKRIN
jgi:uncharacterized protein (TIRG00374 family)